MQRMRAKKLLMQDKQKRNSYKFKWITNYTEFTDKYAILDHDLGCGNFGTVKAVLQKDSQIPCAVKIVKKAYLRRFEGGLDLMRSELETMEESDHPNVTQILQLLEDDENIYIVMELLTGGNLQEVFNDNMCYLSDDAVNHVMK